MSDPHETSDPSTFLSEIIGAPITVKLNSGVEYKGIPVPSLSGGAFHYSGDTFVKLTVLVAYEVNCRRWTGT